MATSIKVRIDVEHSADEMYRSFIMAENQMDVLWGSPPFKTEAAALVMASKIISMQSGYVLYRARKPEKLNIPEGIVAAAKAYAQIIEDAVLA